MSRKKKILVQKEDKDNQSKVKKDYGFKVLNEETKQKALLASEAHIFKLNKENMHEEPIFLQIGTVIPTCKEKEFTRRMISIPNRLRKVKNVSILLVTKDPVDEFRAPLSEKGCATDDVFADIVGYKRFKSMVGTSKKALKTYHEYDMIVTDNKLHPLLPNLLESTIFCKNTQKFPLMVQMAQQSVDVKQVQKIKLRKMEKRKDNRVEPDYILGQIKAWCRNTTFSPSTGPVLSILVGYSDMKGYEVVENIDSVLSFLTNKEFKPIGGIIASGSEGILDLHLRANDKTLPIMKKGEHLVL